MGSINRRWGWLVTLCIAGLYSAGLSIPGSDISGLGCAGLRRAAAQEAHRSGAAPERSAVTGKLAVPDKLVVLTFDDAAKSHFTVARPLLLKYKFGATFFVTEGFDFKTNKRDYLSWEEIAQLHRDGFEIGNHTRDHLAIKEQNVAALEEQLQGIEDQCARHGIPRPVTFAWPGNSFTSAAFPILQKHGIQFARRGGAPEYPYEAGRGFAYEPGLDHPLLLPSAGDARPSWELEDLKRAVEQARHGRIAVLQFHGVPDTAHSWVNTPQQKFAAFMNYLAVEGYRVIALRDLARYVAPEHGPNNPQEVIDDRQRTLKAGVSRENVRVPRTPEQLQYWLKNLQLHGFNRWEMSAATGLPQSRLKELRRQGKLDALVPVDASPPGGPLTILPYPGGRHPRIAFRDGAMRPQRETKVSVFTPWKGGGYVVVDLPEAIWWNTATGRELLYLAHTHVPTTWSKQGQTLPPTEWKVAADGSLAGERELPNKVRFGAALRCRGTVLEMELWIENGSDQTLRGLQVQNCVMLAAAPQFNELTVDNKVFRKPLAAVGNAARDRWVITGWEHCQRCWGNPRCPCLHSDPQFPDCEPGERQTLRGRLWFYEGGEIQRHMDEAAEEWFAVPPK